MAKLGEEVTEVPDYLPGHFQVIRHVGPKYACTACDVITQAPAPPMPTPVCQRRWQFTDRARSSIQETRESARFLITRL